MGKPRRAMMADAEETITPPDALTSTQSLVKVIKPEGNNVYTCQLPNKNTVQLELAQRFRNTIWIRRGGFVLAERYPADSEEKRVAGEIVNIVRDEKLWRKQPYWPKEFVKSSAYSDSEDDSNVGKMPPSDSEDEN